MTIKRIWIGAVLACGLLQAGEAEDKQQINAALDDWHAAAAEAKEDRYFNRFTKDGIFLGTDAEERWTVAEFRKFAHPYFARGKAWNFKPVKRFVTLAPDGKIAWFDEQLDTPNLGPSRGSGVLMKEGTEWKIAHYNLTVPIPNPLMSEIKNRIENFLKK